MKEIRGNAKNIRALLSGAKYAIDYYQREYRWEQKQIVELIEDLVEKFQESHKADNERSDVEGYSHYFLGSIIISDKDGQKYIIDGQQRLTSLTLLLIFLCRKLSDGDQRAQLTELVFSKKYGKRSFNLNVPERTPAMEALFAGDPFDEDDQPESVENIIGRFEDIEETFPDDLCGDALPFFADWLIENVHLVEITAYSDADAYTIFETMNDRGLSLTPTDMLKGYLLANVTDAAERKRASQRWRDLIAGLQGLGKEEDADAIKAWLRGQHAQTIRERKRGATAKDFDLLGTEFHRWVRDHEDALGLTHPSSFAKFIEGEFNFFARWYRRIREASETLTEGMEAVYYNAKNRFTLQYPLLLAPLCIDDSEQTALKKIRLAAGYLDIIIARRIWNSKSTSYSTMSYNVFLIIKEIRRRSPEEMVDLLTARLDEDEYQFAANDRFALTGMNRKQIHRLLSRMTDYLETESGRSSRYPEYTGGKGKKKYEVEHIWANHFDRHTDEFEHATDFTDHRNRIGGLLLLPKSFNASYSDLPYGPKREHYVKQNLLALSLHEKAYENDPGFKRFVKVSGLPFVAHGTFKKADLDARQVLYQRLAQRVWSPANLKRELDG